MTHHPTTPIHASRASFGRVLAWMTLDTARQAWSSGLVQVVLLATALVAGSCLGLGTVEEAPIPQPGCRPASVPESIERRAGGELRLAFGLLRIPLGRDPTAAVRELQQKIAQLVSGSAGLMLTLVWTAAFVPSFLRDSRLAPMLARPVSRTALFGAKIVSVHGLVLGQGALFVVATWIAIGLATGFWETGYLLSIGALLLNFTAVYSFSIVAAVLTRHAIPSILAGVFFWLICWAIGIGYARLEGMRSAEAIDPAFSGALGICYGLLPKPDAVRELLSRAIEAGDAGWSSAWALAIGSLALPAVFYLVAMIDFARRDAVAEE